MADRYLSKKEEHLELQMQMIWGEGRFSKRRMHRLLFNEENINPGSRLLCISEEVGLKDDRIRPEKGQVYTLRAVRRQTDRSVRLYLEEVRSYRRHEDGNLYEVYWHPSHFYMFDEWLKMAPCPIPFPVQMPLWLMRNEPIELYVEVARHPWEKAQSLRFREKPGPFDGMLHVYGRGLAKGFHTGELLFSIDRIFLDKNGKVLEIQEDIQPMHSGMMNSQHAYRYVLEVKSGFGRHHDLRPGDAFLMG